MRRFSFRESVEFILSGQMEAVAKRRRRPHTPNNGLAVGLTDDGGCAVRLVFRVPSGSLSNTFGILVLLSRKETRKETHKGTHKEIRKETHKKTPKRTREEGDQLPRVLPAPVIALD